MLAFDKEQSAHDSIEWWPVLLGLMFLYVPTLWDLSTTIWREDDHSHGPIVLTMVIWMTWRARGAIGGDSSNANPRTGFSLLAFGLLLYAFGRSQNIALFEVGSALPILSGVVLATRGAAVLKSWSFPLCFLLFLLPLPGPLVDAVTLPLKQSVSALAETVLHTAQYPVARAGVVLQIGSYQLLVADACSGLNSMFTLLAVGLFYVYLMRYKGWLHNAVLLVSVLPIAFFANVVRVIILILATYHLGDSVGQGITHGAGGLVLFVIALGMLLSEDLLLNFVRASALRMQRVRPS